MRQLIFFFARVQSATSLRFTRKKKKINCARGKSVNSKVTSMKEKLRELYRDSLFQNSLYLMLTTAVMALFGFGFWFLCARIFTPSDIGIATTLISAMTLISYVSLLGFNSTFVRVLPTSTNRNNEINTGLILCISSAIIFAIGYVLAVPLIAPKLGIIHEHIFYAIGFVALVALAAINLLTDSIFIAYRAAKYNFWINGIAMSSVKLFLPFVFIGLGAYGVFAASGIAASVAMVLSITFLILKFDYQPQLNIDIQTWRSVIHYSFSNYIANLLNIAPILILPLIVINHLGAAAAGYYYLAFTVANLLYAVIYSVTQSLFAEGSYADRSLTELAAKSLLAMGAVLIPGSIILFFAAPIFLNIYGASYAVEATGILQAFALAGPAVALYTIMNMFLRIKKQVYRLIAVNIVYVITMSGLALLWVDKGLAWIGYAWLIGSLVAGITGLILYRVSAK